jgi:hypothetical protein
VIGRPDAHRWIQHVPQPWLRQFTGSAKAPLHRLRGLYADHVRRETEEAILALAAFPFTPEHSMRALRHFYHRLGHRIWGDYGFIDAFSETTDWYAASHLAIDQGPIIGMIENARTGMLWRLFMSCPEIRQGLNRLDFRSPHLADGLVS